MIVSRHQPGLLVIYESTWDSFQNTFKAYMRDYKSPQLKHDSIKAIQYINSIHLAVIICENEVAISYSGEILHLCEMGHTKTHFL